MMAHKTMIRSGEVISYVLGQASIWWGLMLLVGYNVGFALLLPRPGHAGTAPQLQLPVELPLVGLLLGALAWAFVRRQPRPFVGYAVAGLVLNAIPLAFALILRWLGA
jgi:hypothetical protein